MELIDAYMKMDRYNQKKSYNESWAPLYESDAQTLAIYAGKNTGAVYNVSNFIAMSEQPSIVVCQFSDSQKIMSAIMSCTRITSVKKDESLVSTILQKSSGELIRICSIVSAPAAIEKLMHHNSQIIFYNIDPDRSSLIRKFQDNLTSDQRILAVSELTKKPGTEMKRFFLTSDEQHFVDSKISEVPYTKHELYYPSQNRKYIEVGFERLMKKTSRKKTIKSTPLANDYTMQNNIFDEVEFD